MTDESPIIWSPALYGDIDDMIQEAERQMEPPVKAFWDKINIVPQKWQLPPWGDEGGGFWVVALVGQDCIYFNDIEDGFNISRFETLGVIQEYVSEQTELIFCIRSYYQAFLDAINPIM
ncbi:MAG: hypothetical protein M3Y13_10450 [Armatimonadota bacterium]|nr:hypothetical protein [Armatimonadota bacterium]